jgi:hypothetical protein
VEKKNSQCFTPLVDVRICTHVPKSTRNKNVKFGKPYLRPKIGFFGPQNTAVLLGHSRKKLFFDFEPYDLANGKE